jgi:Ala-tRNA(Pro) deacylase
MNDTYRKLLALLDEKEVAYRLIDHEQEGQTEKVSALRGNPLAAAAKCIILIVKLGKKTTRFVLAVVPGDRRVDIGKVRGLFPGATYVGFAASEIAERLAGSVAGTVLPFAMHPDITVIADPGLQANPELFFNAARLDQSMALSTADYLAVAQPRLESIATS